MQTVLRFAGTAVHVSVPANVVLSRSDTRSRRREENDVDDETLYAPSWVEDDLLPTELATMIVPGLYQGGTPDDAWVDTAARLHRGDDTGNFDAVVTLFAWAQPCSWGVEELRYGFADAHPDLADMSRVVAAARWAHERWTTGARVLIRCQAGLNRSGLVTVLVLMLAGYTAQDAIRLVRERRSPYALFNPDFVDWLLEDAPASLLGDVVPS
jgi:hypothetical protein